MEISINLNEVVHFTLTEYGAMVWNQHYIDLGIRSPEAVAGPRSDQLWAVMNILGHKMFIGATQAIEGNVVILRRSEL